MYDLLRLAAVSPLTGDSFRPWIAAVILIVSIIVLVGLFVFSRKDTEDKQEKMDSFEDEDN
jgi:uncharacterized membrane protein SirB2